MVRQNAKRTCRVLCLLLAGSAGLARADGFNGQASGSYLNSHAETTVGGQTQRTDTNALLQDYRLSLDRSLFPHLVLSLGGAAQLADSWSRSAGAELGGASGHTSTLSDDVLARLKLDSGLFALAGGYDRRESRVTGRGAPEIRETYDVDSTWRPVELPTLSLLYRRTLTYDGDRAHEDRTDDNVTLNSDYGIGRFRSNYVAAYLRSVDAIGGSQSNNFNQALRANWGDSALDRRLTYYLNGTLGFTSQETSVSGPNATIATQRFPIAGLSILEAFPATPDRDTLAINPALIDGNVDAAAGINLGFARTAAGDTVPRDLGVQMADVVTKVNVLRVWVDRALPPAVSAAFTWAVYQSDDNVTWAQVIPIKPVTFGQIDHRFEIGIPDTTARYLKVVTRPLVLGVTTDVTFGEIQVTELQVLQLLSGSAAATHRQAWTEQFSGSSRLLLMKQINLAYDASFQFSRAETGPTTWSLVNGLSLDRRLNSWLGTTARAANTLVDSGVGRQSAWAVGASLVATPIPTLYSALSVGWQRQDATAATAASDGVSASLFNRAALYQGVDLIVNASANKGSNTQGIEGTTVLLTSSLAVTPHRRLSLTGGQYYQWSSSTRSGITTEQVLERWDASGTFSPTDAITASGTLSWLVKGPTPTTTATGSVAYTPLSGDLQLSVLYVRTNDSGTRSSSSALTSGLRWTFIPRASFTASYSLTSAADPTTVVNARSFFLNLIITLG